MGVSIATQTTRAAGLSAISNLIAQAISAKANGKASLQFDVLLKYILYSILNAPLNCLWQDYLEQQFPSYEKTKKPTVSIAQRNESDQPQRLTNLAWKFLLDQTVGAAANVSFSIVVSGLLNGASLEQVANSMVQVRLPGPQERTGFLRFL